MHTLMGLNIILGMIGISIPIDKLWYSNRNYFDYKLTGGT